MAKAKTTSSRSPFSYVIGDPITKGDAQVVHEMQNFARCEAVHVLANGCGPNPTTTSFDVSPHGPLRFPATSKITVYRFAVWVDPDLVTLNVRTVATLPGGATGSVIVTLGGTSCTTSHTAGGTSTDNDTLAVASVGVGWQTCTIELQADSGDPSTGTLDRWRIRSAVIAASALPDPQ